MTFQPRVFLVTITVVLAAAVALSWVAGLPFWAAMLIVLFALLVNGYIATVEDRDAGV